MEPSDSRIEICNIPQKSNLNQLRDFRLVFCRKILSDLTGRSLRADFECCQGYCLFSRVEVGIYLPYADCVCLVWCWMWSGQGVHQFPQLPFSYWNWFNKRRIPPWQKCALFYCYCCLIVFLPDGRHQYSDTATALCSGLSRVRSRTTACVNMMYLE